MDLRRAIRNYLRRRGIHLDELEQEEKPMQKIREKQGEGMWQADIGMEAEGEEERKRREEKRRKDERR